MTVLHKDPQRKLTILTCYDFPTARALDETDVDVVFVGDSVGTNVLGYRSELEVTLDDIIHHLKAVRRGINSDKLIMADLPYGTYDNAEQAVSSARALTQRGADIVKLEGGAAMAPIVQALVADGIAVMSHIGFQPQVLKNDKRSVVGTLHSEAKAVFDDACALQEAGACAILVECVPEMVCKEISPRLRVPTIGIGSGGYCDGQVLVITDVLGWYDMPFRFVKRYANFRDDARRAAAAFVAEVRSGDYPARNHGFRIRREELESFRELLPPL